MVEEVEDEEGEEEDESVDFEENVKTENNKLVLSWDQPCYVWLFHSLELQQCLDIRAVKIV